MQLSPAEKAIARAEGDIVRAAVELVRSMTNNDIIGHHLADQLRYDDLKQWHALIASVSDLYRADRGEWHPPATPAQHHRVETRHQATAYIEAWAQRRGLRVLWGPGGACAAGYCEAVHGDPLQGQRFYTISSPHTNESLLVQYQQEEA